MSRTPENKDWISERSVGRRSADRGVCVFHDLCHESMAGMKQSLIDSIDHSDKEFEKMRGAMKLKLDSKIAILIVSTMITVLLTIGVLAVPQIFKATEAIVRMDTNQRHLMEELSVKPIK